MISTPYNSNAQSLIENYISQFNQGYNWKINPYYYSTGAASFAVSANDGVNAAFYAWRRFDNSNILTTNTITPPADFYLRPKFYYGKLQFTLYPSVDDTAFATTRPTNVRFATGAVSLFNYQESMNAVAAFTIPPCSSNLIFQQSAPSLTFQTDEMLINTGYSLSISFQLPFGFPIEINYFLEMNFSGFVATQI